MAEKLENEIVISVKDLEKSFGENHVLRKFNIKVHRNENVVVMGRSGTGKSVLIKCMVGLLEPDSGEITVLGNDVTKLTQRDLDLLRSKIGFLFQSNALYDSMTVERNLEFPLRKKKHHKRDRVELDEMIKNVLESVGLDGTQKLFPSELSGGMKKRIALARTLIMNPEIILYDEPTAGLDPITAREISKLINDVQKKHKSSSLIITHDVECAKITANNIVVLHEGEVHAEGTFEDMKKSNEQLIQSFFA